MASCFRKLIISLVVCALPLTLTAQQEQTETPTYETHAFVRPPMQWRPIPLWFWNNTQVSGNTIVQQLQQMIETDGYGGCAILPFGQNFRPSYLSSAYFTLYAKAVEKARALGAHMSIYDEYGFPSGSMGAINGSGVTTFKNNHPEHTVKRLDKSEYRVASGATIDRTLTPKGQIMALVARNVATKEVVSLREFYDPTTHHLTWTAPAGNSWSVMLFDCVVDGDPNVDYLSPEAVSLFIQDTHEAYYSHFPDEFGQTVVSTFFDEPTMYRAAGRMWTGDFNAKFEQRYGFSPELLYPALWYDIGPQTPWARNLLFGLHSTLYSEGFMKTISDWATAHGIIATGHQDQEEIANPTSVAGDLMLVGKHLAMPGIDKIGNGRATEDFYKVVSSSANCWDKNYVMSETYGAMGNIPVEKLYEVAIEQYTKGINHLIPHAVWYNTTDVTFLPELSWRNPLYNSDLPSFNRFLARLNYLLARPGRHVADVAMLYPIQTLYAGHYFDGPKGYYEGGVEVPGTDYPLVSHLLTDDLGTDFTYLHPEVIDDRCTAEGGRLHLNNEVNHEQFSVIILPGVKTIALSNLRKIEEAWKQGMRVVFTTQLPQQAADTPDGNDEVKDIIARMQASEDNPALYVQRPTAASLKAALDACLPQRDVAFEGGTHPFNYLHKMVDGHDVYYFGNIDATSAINTIRVRTSSSAFSLLNPHTGAVSAPSHGQLIASNDNTGTNVFEFELQLRPCQSVFLVDDALLLKNATPDDPVDVRPSYTIEALVDIEQLSAGLCFAQTDNNNFYMWQFNVSDPNHPRLRPHRWTGGSAAVLAEIDLPANAAIRAGELFRVRIEVEEESFVRTFINDVLVDERSGKFVYGRIGFRQAHDDAYGKTEIARYDNIRIKSADGQVLFEEEFSERNPFSAGTLTDGWLRVEGQMSRDILSWLRQTPPLNAIHDLKAESNRGPLPLNRQSAYNLQGMPATAATGLFITRGKKYYVH